MPACKRAIPLLVALDIRVELWLGEDDSIASARYLFAHANETASDLLAIARATPGIVGFNIDLETRLGTEADARAYTAFLATVTTALAATPSGPLRFSADVSCSSPADAAAAPPLLSNCSLLATSGVGRLMDMRT